MRLLALAFVLALAPIPAAPAAAAGRPNLVVIMADDLDVGSLDVLIRAGLVPNLQKHVIEAGVTFANSFVTNALCAPSRATFLTGQYSHRHGVRYNKGGPAGGFAAFDDRSTLPTWLRSAGYRTGHVGKYLNGYGRELPPFPGSPVDDPRKYVPPGWDDWQGLVGTSTYDVYNYWINDNGRLVFYGEREEDYQTDALARRAVRFIDESPSRDGQPFFLLVTPLAPHFEATPDRGDWWTWTIRPAPRHLGSTAALALPVPPSFNEADLSDKPAWLKAFPLLSAVDVGHLTRQYQDRLASFRAVDDLIGRIVHALGSNGELEKTVLLFTSDNGFLKGEHRLSQKQCAYEESIRVPLAVRGPGIRGGRQIHSLVTNNDLAPTLADWAGAIPTAAVDGRSLLPLLGDGPAPAWRTRTRIEHVTPPLADTPLPSYSAVRTVETDPRVPGRKYVEYEDGSRELFDLIRDPYELDSVHDDPARTWERELLENHLRRRRVASLESGGLEDD